MAYGNGFVLSITKEGKAVKEHKRHGNSIAFLPFDTEYGIRIKNKTDRNAKADIFIDGKSVSCDRSFVVRPYETMNLERFLADRLDKGRKFKFVPADHPDVDDPTHGDNGLIEVRLYKEKVQEPKWYYRRFSHAIPCAATLGSRCASGQSLSLQGATVEGSYSNQKFIEVNEFETDNFPIVLKVKIQGLREHKPVPTHYSYCPNCGMKMGFRRANYCSHCGYKLN